MKTLTTLFAALAVTATAAASAGAQVHDWNRRVDAIGILPDAAGGQQVHAVWTVELGAPAQTTLVLSTEAVLFVNGAETQRDVVDIVVFAGSGNCGACAGGCGQGAVNGMAAALLCLEEGQVGCSCQFPPITSSFPTPLSPGDEIMVLLRPAPGASPDTHADDDLKTQEFDGDPVHWDRRLTRAEFVQVSGAPAGVFDLEIEWQLAMSELSHSIDVSPSFEIIANGQTVMIYGPPCGPWFAAPGSGCDQAQCPGGACGLITCNGQTLTPMSCHLTENEIGLQFCACLSSAPFLEVIPGLTWLDPLEDEIVVILKPAPGALPELPGLDEDEEVPEVDLGNWEDLGNALRGTYEPVLVGAGTLLGGDVITLSLADALENAPAWLVVGVFELSAPFKGGVLVPDPSPPGLTLALPTGAAGTAQLAAPLPFGLPSGFELFFQWWIQDPVGPMGFAASNAVKGTTP